MSNRNTNIRNTQAPATSGDGSTNEFTVVDAAGANVNQKVPAGYFTQKTGLIRLVGEVAFGAGTLTLKIYSGADKTGTLLVTSGAVTPAAGQFVLEVIAGADPLTNKLQGIVYGHLGNTVVAQAAISGGTFDPTVENTLSVSYQWGTGNASNKVTLRELAIDRL